MKVSLLQKTLPTGEVRSIWAAYFRLDGKTYRKQGFASEAEATKWIQTHTTRLRKGAKNPTKVSQPRHGMTCGKLFDEWLIAVEKGSHGRSPVERSTLKRYATAIEKYLRPQLGGELLVDADSTKIAELRAILISKNTRANAARLLKTLRQVFNYAVETGRLVVNTADKIRVASESRQDKKLAILSREEVAKIIAELTRRFDAKPSSWACFGTLFVTLQATGLRISEARGLTWSAINLSQRTLTVKQRADSWNQLGRVKSQAAYRVVMLDNVSVAWLQRWKNICPPSPIDLVFPNKLGKVESYANLRNRKWLLLCRDLGLVDDKGSLKYGFHSARHYRVSELLAAGANINLVMDQVGHASSAVTYDVYGHLMSEDQAAHRKIVDGISSNTLAETNSALAAEPVATALQQLVKPLRKRKT